MTCFISLGGERALTALTLADAQFFTRGTVNHEMLSRYFVAGYEEGDEVVGAGLICASFRSAGVWPAVPLRCCWGERKAPHAVFARLPRVLVGVAVRAPPRVQLQTFTLCILHTASIDCITSSP